MNKIELKLNNNYKKDWSILPHKIHLLILITILVIVLMINIPIQILKLLLDMFSKYILKLVDEIKHYTLYGDTYE